MSLLENENHTGKSSLQAAASDAFSLTNFSSLKRLVESEKRISHAGLVQALARTLDCGFRANQTLASLAARLVSIADHAQFLRRIDIVDCIGQLFLELPFPRQWEGAGRFYRALGINQSWKGDVDLARRWFEKAADTGSLEFRRRAILALGTDHFRKGEHQHAVQLYREVMSLAMRGPGFDPVTSYLATRMTAAIRSLKGDHRGALDDLERMTPLARVAASVEPEIYYDYLNSLAVELGEAGRFEQARHAAAIAIASPYAAMYPEWRDTFDEIESKNPRASRSIIAVSQVRSERDDPPTEIMSWADGHTRPADFPPQRANRSARIVCLQDWKKKLEKSQDNSRKKPTVEDIRSMAFTEKQATITRYVYADDVTEDMLDSILQVTSISKDSERDGA